MKAATATPVFPISEQCDGFDFDPEMHYAQVLVEAGKKPPSSSNISNQVVAGSISSSKGVDVDKAVADVKKKRSWKNALFFWKKLSSRRKQEKEQRDRDMEVQSRPRRSGFKSRSGPIYMNDFHVQQPRCSSAAHSGPLSATLTPREGDLANIPYMALKHPNQGLGNKFLSHIREVDSIAQIEKRMERLKKRKPKDSQAKVKEETEMAALPQIHEALMAGKPARSVNLSDYEKEAIRHLCLLTMKPVIYVANVAESDLIEPTKNPHVKAVVEIASELSSEVVAVSAQVEAELTELQPEERIEYLKSLGVTEGGLGSLIRATYNLLGLRTYLTTGEKETKAWTIIAGMTAPQAAGVIHSDFEKGFIRAETVSYSDYVAAGSLAAAREKGLVRVEGKDYVVQEGDVMLFRFNV